MLARGWAPAGFRQVRLCSTSPLRSCMISLPLTVAITSGAGALWQPATAATTTPRKRMRTAERERVRKKHRFATWCLLGGANGPRHYKDKSTNRGGDMQITSRSSSIPLPAQLSGGKRSRSGCQADYLPALTGGGCEAGGSMPCGAQCAVNHYPEPRLRDERRRPARHRRTRPAFRRSPRPPPRVPRRVPGSRPASRGRYRVSPGRAWPRQPPAGRYGQSVNALGLIPVLAADLLAVAVNVIDIRPNRPGHSALPGNWHSLRRAWPTDESRPEGRPCR